MKKELNASEEKISKFIEEVAKEITLSKYNKNKLLNDYEKAIRYLVAKETPIEEVLERVSSSNLGGFYSRPAKNWYDLDNAAKIYPFSMKHGYMALFRMSVYLKEDVVPAILQLALNFTIKRFPSFATTLKNGFFWHYLEVTKRRFEVEQEHTIPCSPIHIGRSGSQSFRILYYKNRISAEFFHVLTDGYGGSIFLKTLVCEYYRLLGVNSEKIDGVLDINDITKSSETTNEFKNIKTKKSSGFANKTAVQLSGTLAKLRPCRVLHFKMNCDELKSVAKSKNSTITEYLLSLMFVACKQATEGEDGEFSIQVPVNMRKFYNSDTLRNFSMYCGIRIPLKDIVNADNLLESINKQLKEKASLEEMSNMVNSANQLTKSAKYIPLSLKKYAISKIYGFLGDRLFTSTFSNMGIVKFPNEIEEHIESMDFVLGTAIYNRASCSLITTNNISTFSISKNTIDPSFEEKMYELLTNDGINVNVEGSDIYEG